jgi:regulator of cell morphogenesis and NO signaling
MNALNERTIGELVAERPRRSRIFEKLGIDYCCGGKRRLDDACNAKGLDANTVAVMLEAFDADGQVVDEQDWRTESLEALCDNIEKTHHSYLKVELPDLQALVNKVAAVHGHLHPELIRVVGIFNAFRKELEHHMQKEETVLFPYVRQLEHSATKPDFPCACKGLLQATETMESEHEHAGQALESLRKLLNNYRVPEGACNSYRAMLDRLEQLERDMHVHVHKENSILFPRAIALEHQRGTSHGGAR